MNQKPKILNIKKANKPKRSRKEIIAEIVSHYSKKADQKVLNAQNSIQKLEEVIKTPNSQINIDKI